MTEDAKAATAAGEDGELDEQLETCVRLASQMRSLGSLYHAVVHDLKSPLNTLVVNLELLSSTLDPDGPQADKQKRYVRVLQEEMQRLNRSIEKLMPAAAPPSDARGRFELADVLREIEILLSTHARHHSVALDIGYPAEKLPLEGYRDQVKLALLAVAINGLEAMPDGGRLRVEASREDGRALVVVRDRGKGIPPEAEEVVYDLAYTTKNRRGGLGLHVAREVVKSTNGTIAFDSEPGRGTRFELRFPLAQER